MATRNIREMGDSVLNKVSKEVKDMTQRTADLIDDMFDTMYEAQGVGLAAPQVGILKRIFVIDVTGEDPFVFINPEILETDGEQTGYEGCLSVPGKSGMVTRPNFVRVRALDENMEEFELEAEELMARAILHEYDHLDGILFVDHAINRFEAEEQLSQNDLPPLEIEKMVEEPELDEKINQLLEAVEVEEEVEADE